MRWAAASCVARHWVPAVAPDSTARKPAGRFDKLKGIDRRGWSPYGLKSTDEIMGWLRGYGDDKRDPGFEPRAEAAKRKK